MSFGNWIQPALGVTALIAVGVGPAWYIQEGRLTDSRDRVANLERQIDALKGSDSWKLPETIKQLEVISGRLHQQFAEQDSLVALKKQNADLQGEVKKLHADIAEKDELLLALGKDLLRLQAESEKARAQAEEFAISVGSSVDLIKNDLTLAVSDLGFESSAYVLLDNEQFKMSLGEYRDVTASGRECRLTLASTVPADKTATFRFICF